MFYCSGAWIASSLVNIQVILIWTGQAPKLSPGSGRLLWQRVRFSGPQRAVKHVLRTMRHIGDSRHHFVSPHEAQRQYVIVISRGSSSSAIRPSQEHLI